MRLLMAAILLATIALASVTQGHIKRQAIQSHWETPKAYPSTLTETQNFPYVNSKPISLASISEPATQNSDINQITADQILKQVQQSTNIYNYLQLLQSTPSQTQLNYNYNPFNPGAYYITNPNPNQVQNAELTSSAEVKPVQHSSVVNHGSYNPFESLSLNQAPLHKRPQSQPYAPIKLNLPAQPYALPQPQLQAHFVPQKRPQYQVQPQQLVTPNVYNFAPQAPKSSPNRYNFQSQPQKPVARINNAQYNPLSAVLNPYQPQKASLTPSSTPVPFHARPQSFQTIAQKQKPNTTPSRDSHRDDVKNVREEEIEDAREIDDREDDDENVSKEEYHYRDDDGNDSDESIDEVDSREYRPSFQAARYIFNRGGESEEEDEDSSSSNVYPKSSKHYKYDDNPFSKHYGNEHKQYLARYKKSRYYKPKKNKEPTYELEGKASQNIPVAVRNQKLVEEKWFVTKKE